MSPSSWISNWERSQLRFDDRLRVALGNLWRRATRLDVCCGHPGEPGC